MPNGEDTQFTMTITRRIDGHDYVVGKQFSALNRGIPGRNAGALGEVALALMERIDDADSQPTQPTKHS
jgi:hypothetical protein